MKDKLEDRRGIDKMIRTVFVSLTVGMLSSLGYITYAAGETKKTIEVVVASSAENTKQLDKVADKVLENSLQVKQISKTQDKTVRILEKVSDRLRDIEVKIEGIKK